MCVCLRFQIWHDLKKLNPSVSIKIIHFSGGRDKSKLAVVSALISNFFKRLEVRLIDLQLAPAHSPPPQLWPPSGKEKAWRCLEKLCGTWRSGCFIGRKELPWNNPALWGALSKVWIRTGTRTCQWCQVQSHNNTTRSRVPGQPLGPGTPACVHTRAGHGTKRALLLVVPSRSGEKRHRPLLPLCILHQGSPWTEGRSPARLAPKLLVLTLGFKTKKCHQKRVLVSLFRAAQEYCLLLRKFYVNDNRSSWLCSTLYWFYDVPLCRHFI